MVARPLLPTLPTCTGGRVSESRRSEGAWMVYFIMWLEPFSDFVQVFHLSTAKFLCRRFCFIFVAVVFKLRSDAVELTTVLSKRKKKILRQKWLLVL